MRKLLMVLAFTLLFAPSVLDAQTTTNGNGNFTTTAEPDW